LEQATQWMLQTIGEDPDAAPVASVALLCRQYAQTFEGTAEERLAYAGLPRFTVAASTKPPTRRPTRLHVVLGDPLLE